MEPLTYTGMPDIWCRWAMNKVREHRDMVTLAECGIKFFDVDAVVLDRVDWESVTIAEVDNER